VGGEIPPQTIWNFVDYIYIHTYIHIHSYIHTFTRQEQLDLNSSSSSSSSSSSLWHLLSWVTIMMKLKIGRAGPPAMAIMAPTCTQAFWMNPRLWVVGGSQCFWGKLHWDMIIFVTGKKIEKGNNNNNVLQFESPGILF
jgi:hypothetical protein